MGITVKQMIEEMPELAKIVMPPRTRISRKTLIELVYHQRKVDEVLNRHRGKDWAWLLRALDNQAHELPENSMGYQYWHKLL